MLCVATTVNQAEAIVYRLQNAGFPNDGISALLPTRPGSLDAGLKKGTKAPRGAALSLGTGPVLGGVLGCLTGLGSLEVRGTGPLLAGGPIAAALSGATARGGIGGITVALTAMGLPESEAKRFEGKLKQGNILISVQADDFGEVTRAKEIFEHAGADDITTAGGLSAGNGKRPSREAS